jgi:hypothetical protein
MKLFLLYSDTVVVVHYCCVDDVCDCCSSSAYSPGQSLWNAVKPSLPPPPKQVEEEGVGLEDDSEEDSEEEENDEGHHDHFDSSNPHASAKIFIKEGCKSDVVFCTGGGDFQYRCTSTNHLCLDYFGTVVLMQSFLCFTFILNL